MNRIYILSIMCLLSVAVTGAEKKNYKGQMGITPRTFEQRGDSLYIGIDFDFQNVTVSKRSSISLIPVLTSPSGEVKLPEVMVKGRENYLTSKREVALMNKRERRLYEQTAPYAIVKGYKSKGDKQLQYNKALLFEPWMKDAGLDVREDLCGCGNPPRILGVSPLINKMQSVPVAEPYTVTPHLAYVKPDAPKIVLKREIAGDAFLNFVVSKIDIRPNYLDNPRELKKITDLMEEVKSDTAVTVKAIFVEGYASPEGPLKFNRYLSEGRAKALVDYLHPRFNYPKEMYHVVFGGENWKGLKEAVTGSDMKYRNDVLAILNNTSISDDARKLQLKQLKGGEPYMYMLKEYYPYLRKASCKIDFEIDGFDAEKAKGFIKTAPGKLSLDEMYLLANTYQVGSREFCDVFEVAAAVYPADEVSNLNAAASALSRRDTDKAAAYLSKVKTTSAEYNNSMGVLMMLKGDYTAAAEYLRKASDSGLESAVQNLMELQKRDDSITK